MSADGTRLPDLEQERFESLEPPARVLAELLPYRPVLIDRRLHGAVVLRLHTAGVWVEYVECSARTSMAMVIARSGQVLVLRRTHNPIDSICAAALAVGVALFGWAVMLGSLGIGGALGWGLCAAGAMVAVIVGVAIFRRVRRRGRGGRWSAMSEADWELTLERLDPMVASGATSTDLVAMVDEAARFS